MSPELKQPGTGENPATRTIEMDASRKCSADCCENAAITFFLQRELCLNHFILRCYEDLERIDPRAQRQGERGGYWCTEILCGGMLAEGAGDQFERARNG